MPNNIERKYIDLKDLKVSDDGPGTIEGYRAVFHEIDEGGDLIVKGFFADTLTEYLEAGFSAHSHDWSFKEAVGFPVEAKEDDHGLFVVSRFHSTDDAQDIRKKAKERKDAGKKVGFSFGYSVSDKSYVEAKDYKEQLPLYIKADRLQANLQKAQKFDRIRILKKGEVIEDSIVTAPMNKMAGATAIKSEPQLFEPQLDALIQAHGKDKVIEYLKGISEPESFESFESAESAIKKFAQKMQSNHENRVKEGRMLSSSNRTKIQTCMESMSAVMVDLQNLMDMSEPKPKEKAVNVVALRTQSQRLRSQATRTLAHVS